MNFYVFQSCQSLDDHLLTTKGNPLPYFIASGTSKVLPCQSCTVHPWVCDDLFKSNFVFSVQYHDALFSLYTFVQTTMFKMYKGTTEESPKVKEQRARLLNKQ